MDRKIPVLFKEKKECCGCTACYAICSQMAISMIEDEEGFVYPYDEYYMLAYHIKYVFDCKKRIASVTKKAQEHARITHDPMINSSGVMAIYKEIINQ